MNCLNCGGELVMRETFDYPIDDNGVYVANGNEATQTEGVFCAVCGAGHAYNEIHQSEDQVTVALVANSDPKPVTTIAVGFRGGIVEGLGSEQMVGLIAIDEDKEEVGIFLTRHHGDDSPWWQRALGLSMLIEKGKWQASFAAGREDAPNTN